MKFAFFIVLFLFFLLSNILKFLVFEDLENRTWDWRSKISDTSIEFDDRIKIIAIDQSSLDFLEQEYQLSWPIPRETYVYIIDYLKKSGAKGVAFDILYTESASSNMDGDLALAAASSQDFPVIHSFTLNKYSKKSEDSKAEDIAEHELLKSVRRNTSLVNSLIPETYRSLTLPYSELKRDGLRLGFVNAISDEDGVFRKYYHLANFGDQLLPSLPFSFLLNTMQDQFLADEYLEVLAKSSNIVRVHNEKKSYEQFSFASILQSEAMLSAGETPIVSPGVFKDSWVFIGCTAPGLLDLRPTSVEKNGSGVSYVASVFDNLLNNSFVNRPTIVERNLFVFLVLFLALIISLMNLSSYKKSMLAIILGVTYSGVVVGASFYNYWYPFVNPMFSLFIFSFAGLSIDYQFEGRKHRFLRKAFQQYVSPSLINEIVSNPERLSLGGEKKKLTIVFSDIVGFTSVSERINPDSLVELLNEYLTILTEIILEKGGTVDKYVGDAIIAFWNAPVENQDHANSAVNCILDCFETLQCKEDYFISKYGYFPATRFGINTAVVTVGNFGSSNRFNYTVIGDGVNLASRLEGVNKIFGSSIILSKDTNNLLAPNIETRTIGSIRVLGKNDSVEIYEPKTSRNFSLFTDERLKLLREALGKFESGNLTESKELFEKISDDYISQKYIERISKILEEGSYDYDPVWDMKDK